MTCGEGRSAIYAMRKRRTFSEAARAAALAIRRAKAALPKVPDRQFAVFAVRHEDAAGLFAWEIRRYGGVVLARGTEAFPDAAAAAAAGRAARRHRPGAVGPGSNAGGASWTS